MAAGASSALLDLFDRRWFTHEIFKTTDKAHAAAAASSSSSSSSSPGPGPLHQIDENNTQYPDEDDSSHYRSLSGLSLTLSSTPGSLRSHEGLSPSSVLDRPMLQTVLFSGRTEQEDGNKRELSEVPIRRRSSNGGGGRRRRSRGGGGGGVGRRSLSDLEFEELKGFMDLGFVFSEEDKDSRLVAIIPALQIYGGGEQEGRKVDNGTKKADVSRPYLSEAWDVMESEQRDPLINLILPDLRNEIHVKNQLRFWAQTVASALR
ncbi:hypothetical protein Dimus_009479 [Dionaea muscipula]